jgi:hypothetical protein
MEKMPPISWFWNSWNRENKRLPKSQAEFLATLGNGNLREL